MWMHKRYGKTKFHGRYTMVEGERVFVLTGVSKNGKVKNVTAESWQMLKAGGWYKVK